MVSTVRTIVVRTDVTTETGLGHFMRCRSFAQRLREFGVSTRFLMARCPRYLQRKLSDEGFEFLRIDCLPGSLSDASSTARKGADVDWTVVDGYHFRSSYQSSLRRSGIRFLLIDDYAHCDSYDADIILNQNMYASPEMYRSKAPHSRVLVGSDYALIRSEFTRSSPANRGVPKTAKKILVTLGGSDKENHTARVLSAIGKSSVEDLEVKVAIGPINKNFVKIKHLCANSTKRMKAFVNVENLAEMMRWADLAVIAGGTTAYEVAATVTPSVMLVLSENQRLNATEFSRRGYSLVVDEPSRMTDEDLARCLDGVICSYDNRRRMIANMEGAVDGYGPERVLMSMEENIIWMRRAGISDSDILLKWANDDETRRMSYTPGRISKSIHAAWLHSRLNDSSCLLLIAVDLSNSPVGSVRIDSEGHRGSLSLVVDPSKRGRGYSAQMIAMACRMGRFVLGLRSYDAFVKNINKASVRAFEKSGFKLKSSEMVGGVESYRFVLEVIEK